MRNLRLAWLMFGLGLGCSSGSDKSTAGADPASEAFCTQWANEVCRLAYLCVDASAQDAAFRARYGASKDDCWEPLANRCMSNQSGSDAFGPSCGSGKKLNTDLSNACTEALELETCSIWMLAPSGGCELACNSVVAGGGAGNTGGFGNIAGAGNAAGAGNVAGAGGTTGALATRKDFCNAENNVLCDRIFECDPTAMTQYGTVANCKLVAGKDCETASYCPNGFDASKAPGCVDATKNATCTELMGQPPEICTTACF